MSQLFEIMRAIAVREARQDKYFAQAYAWSRRIYPIFQSDGIAAEFKNEFQVLEEKVSQVVDFVDDDWMSEKKITFYDVEAAIGSKWGGSIDRADLIGILRYTFLSDRFDKEMWDRLTIAGSGPVESQGIARDFDPVFDAYVL